MKKLRIPKEVFEQSLNIPCCENRLNDNTQPRDWTIVSALNAVLSLAENSKLSEEFWELCKSPLEFLTSKLCLTKIQVIVIAILAETGESLSWRGIGKFLNCSRLTIMTYSDELEELLSKRWIVKKVAYDMGNPFEGFGLARGVVTALRHNRTFIPEKLDGLQIQEFIDKMEHHLEKNSMSKSCKFIEDEDWLIHLCNANPQLPLCQEIFKHKDNTHTQSLLLLFIFDYAQWADSKDEGLELDTIRNIYYNFPESYDIIYDLENGSHPLIQQGYIEQKYNDGLADNNQFTLTHKFKEEFLCGYLPSRSKCSKHNSNINNLKSHSKIKEKNMFYNQSEQEQINLLTSLLCQDNLTSIQNRLEEQGMRKGFACLFYGAPGTGKTETVLQIAKKTGRDIMQVDIAGMRDKYVGESEKNIKEVFHKYREACNQRDVMPILFFNEADALINKRTDNIKHSVDKMDNAMQNIILQEIENLDGILIATTNLTKNLDDAFERRFLFKIKFNKPEIDVKAKLWNSMLGNGITEDEAYTLANKYDFSGGQIENIARKKTIDYIISGKQPSFNDIEHYCQTELLENGRGEMRSVGFISK